MDCEACSTRVGGTAEGICTPLDPTVAAMVMCRAPVGVCDVPETCDPSSTMCPADVLALVGTECRASTGPCDLAEVCDGTGNDCPADVLAPSGYSCSPGSCVDGVSTSPVLCTGSTAGCPAASMTACAPYACGPSECLVECASNADCAAGYACSGRACIPPPDGGVGPVDAGASDAGSSVDDASVMEVDGGRVSDRDAAQDGAIADATPDAGSGGAVGGCSCRTTRAGSSAGAPHLVWVFVLLWAVRRRRRHRARSAWQKLVRGRLGTAQLEHRQLTHVLVSRASWARTTIASTRGAAPSWCSRATPTRHVKNWVLGTRMP